MCYFWSHISKQWQLIITLLVSICARGINEQLQKTSCADVLSSRKKICKTLGGGGVATTPNLSPLVRPRINIKR